MPGTRLGQAGSERSENGGAPGARHAMKLNRAAIEALSDGIAVLEAGGRIIFLSENAQRALGQHAGQQVNNLLILRAVSSAGKGFAKLPLTFTIRQREGRKESADEIRVSLHHVAEDKYLVLLHDQSKQANLDSIRDNLLEFVNSVLAGRLAELDAAAAKMESALGKKPPQGELGAAAAHLVSMARNIGAVLSEIVNLADYGEADLRRDSQRIAPADLAGDALAEVNSEISRRRLLLTRSGFEDIVPPIYGSRDWLRRALVMILAHFISRLPDHSGVEFQIKHADGHVLFAVSSLGTGLPLSAINMHSVPFDNIAADSAGSGKPLPRLGLLLARSVIEKHAGMIRIDTHCLTVALPSVFPPQEGAEGIEQALRYAHDLKALIIESRINNRERHDG